MIGPASAALDEAIKLLLLVFFGILAPLTLLALVFDLLAALDFLALTGCLITLAAPGVALIVQYHLLLARAQAWPSLAVPYRAVAERLLFSGSINLTWPLVLLRLRAVSAE